LVRTVVLATLLGPSLLDGYLKACLGRLEFWLREWRIAINVSESTAVLFVRAARRVQKSRSVQFLWEPIEGVETGRCLGIEP
jgi:hypothetical protein